MDYDALHAVNDHLGGHLWLAHALAIFSDLSPFIVVAALVAAWFSVRPGSPGRLREGVLGALAAAAIALGINQVVSHIWARPRPSLAHPADVHLWFTNASADPSFPSDHSAAAFAVGFALLFVSRRWGIGMLCLAAAIAISRVAIGLHYPGDVLAGATVGLIAAVVVMYLARRPLAAVTAPIARLSDAITAPIWRRVAPTRRQMASPGA